MHETGDASVKNEEAEKAPGAKCREKPLPPLLTLTGGKGLFNPQKRDFLYEPHHAGITEIKQI